MTVAMLFLIEATTTCGPAAPARLGGGAEVVRAVLDFEDEAAEPAVPTLTSLNQSTGVAPGKAALETNESGSEPTATRCERAAMSIA